MLRVDSKGRVTLPAAARKVLGIEPGSVVEVLLRDDEVAIRRARRVSDIAGVLSRYAKPYSPEEWEAIRQQTEKAVAADLVDRA